jgi:hypothetical protein
MLVLPSTRRTRLRCTCWSLGAKGVMANNSVNRTQIPLRGLCAGYLGRYGSGATTKLL